MIYIWVVELFELRALEIGRSFREFVNSSEFIWLLSGDCIILLRSPLAFRFFISPFYAKNRLDYFVGFGDNVAATDVWRYSRFIKLFAMFISGFFNTEF